MSGRVRGSILVVAALVAALPARAQTGQASAPPPATAPAPAPAPAPPAASPGAPPAGSQGQPSSAQPAPPAPPSPQAAQPSAPPAPGSQQVVVNPAQPVAPAAPPPSTTVVTPPPAGGTGYGQAYGEAYGEVGVTDRPRQRPNPIATVALDGAYGGVAGLLVGGGVALIERENWGRDILVGAGLGIIVGAAVGIVQAVYDSQRPDDRAAAGPTSAPSHTALAASSPPRSALAGDGLGRTDRDPVITARTLGVGFQF